MACTKTSSYISSWRWTKRMQLLCFSIWPPEVFWVNAYLSNELRGSVRWRVTHTLMKTIFKENYPTYHITIFVSCEYINLVWKYFQSSQDYISSTSQIWSISPWKHCTCYIYFLLKSAILQFFVAILWWDPSKPIHVWFGLFGLFYLFLYNVKLPGNQSVFSLNNPWRW